MIVVTYDIAGTATASTAAAIAPRWLTSMRASL